MNAQQLKNAILQEAIQGRLVPQNPNDEPASVLLDRIRKEKAKLVKEGKLKKKDLEEKPITEDEFPYDIPKTWKWVRIKTIFDVSSARRVHEKDWRTKGIPFYRAREIGKLADAGFVDNDLFIDQELYDIFSKSGVPKEGDLMITAVGTLGKVYIVKKGEVFYYKDGSVLCIENKWKINPKYAKYFIESPTFINQYIAESKGTTVATLTMVRVNQYLFPLPPLAEQQRIVAKIEELLPKVEEYGKAQDALDKLNKELPERLKKSILQEAIQGRLVPQDPNDEPASVLLDRIRKEKAKLVKEGKLKKKDLEEKPISEEEKPFLIPKSWGWVRLITLSKIIHYGYTASASSAGNAKLLRITDIQDDKVNWRTVPYCKIKDKDLENYQLHNRDILIARTGGTVGKTYIVRELDEVSVFASYLIRAIPLENSNEEYIKIFMGSPCYWSQLTDATSGTGQPNVNGQSLSNLIIPLPPLAEQQRIVAKIEELFQEIDKLK